jgi:type 1 glutamine amidotransferase
VHPYRWPHRGALLTATVLVAAIAAAPANAVFERQAMQGIKATSAAGSPAYRVLVYTRTTGYRHPSIAAGLATIETLGADNGFAVDTTADPSVFTAAKLSRYATVVFLSTTGNPVPTAPERAAFQHYIENGGGFVGIHAASDAGWNWQWYAGLIGARFSKHPKIQLALVHIEDHHNPATVGLSDRYRLDEWYDFQHDPRGTVHVLADVKDSTYTGSAMGADHPITWCQDYDGGRSFYTAMGHSRQNYDEPFLQHVLLGGIELTAGVRAADCSPN